MEINKSPTVIPLSFKFILKIYLYSNIAVFKSKIKYFYKLTKKILRKYKKTIKKIRLIVVKLYKNISYIFCMDINKKIGNSRNTNFFSNEMIITKRSLNENQLKYTYQKQLISDLDSKHKEWSKSFRG